MRASLSYCQIVEPSEAGDKERDSSVYEGDTGLRTAMASQGSATIANTSSDRGQAEGIAECYGSDSDDDDDDDGDDDDDDDDDDDNNNNNNSNNNNFIVL